MNKEVLIPNFFKVGCNGDKSIRKEDLGWSDSIKRDAQSDNPETIFSLYRGDIRTKHLVLLDGRQTVVHNRDRERPN